MLSQTDVSMTTRSTLLLSTDGSNASEFPSKPWETGTLPLFASYLHNSVDVCGQEDLLRVYPDILDLVYRVLFPGCKGLICWILRRICKGICWCTVCVLRLLCLSSRREGKECGWNWTKFKVYTAGLKPTFFLNQLMHDRQIYDVEHSCLCNQTPAAHFKNWRVNWGEKNYMLIIQISSILPK